MPTPRSVWLIAAVALLAACARDPDDLPVGAPLTEYSALGQEPGWALRIDRDRITYTGDYGATRLAVTRPPATATATGRRYATSRIVVDIVSGTCNDAMSGRGFEDQVVVSIAGRTVRGCGGGRVPAADF